MGAPNVMPRYERQISAEQHKDGDRRTAPLEITSVTVFKDRSSPNVAFRQPVVDKEGLWGLDQPREYHWVTYLHVGKKTRLG